MLAAPGRQVWVDVFLPTGDVLAEPDVAKSFLWLGDAFARAIAKVLGTSAEDARVAVCRAPVRGMPWSKVLCYVGLGAGEVTVAGRKVVGMSQRRDRSGAWIQAMALLDDDAAELPISSRAQQSIVPRHGRCSSMRGFGVPSLRLVRWVRWVRSVRPVCPARSALRSRRNC